MRCHSWLSVPSAIVPHIKKVSVKEKWKHTFLVSIMENFKKVFKKMSFHFASVCAKTYQS